MKVRVTEYWPAFVEGGDERQVSVVDDSEILSVDWLQGRCGPMRFDRGTLDSHYIPQGYVMSGEFIVALVHPHQ